MTTIRQYPKGCDFCCGKGIIPGTEGLSTSTTRICPVCNGSGVIIVTETVDDWLEQIKKIIPKNPI